MGGPPGRPPAGAGRPPRPGGGGIGFPLGDNCGRPRWPGGGGMGLPLGDIGRGGGGGAGRLPGPTGPVRAAPGAGREGAAASAGRRWPGPAEGGGATGRGGADVGGAFRPPPAVTGGRPTGGAAGRGEAKGGDGFGRTGGGLRTAGRASASGVDTGRATGIGAATGAGGDETGAVTAATGGATGGGGRTRRGTAITGAEATGMTVSCFVGSSGWTSRRIPSWSALRRTRSAWGSSIELEWLLTPIPRSTDRSRVSLFVSPSSLANSCTRIFFVANSCLHLFWFVTWWWLASHGVSRSLHKSPLVVPLGVQPVSLARSAT